MVKYEWCVLAKPLANILREILIPGYTRESEREVVKIKLKHAVNKFEQQILGTANNNRQDLVQIACFLF